MPLSGHRQSAFLQRIDEVAYRGFAFIEWWELSLWYEVERIGKNVWRDLRAQFLEVAEKGSDLKYCETPNGILLISSKNIRSVAEKAGI